MANAINTGSTLSLPGGQNKTSTGISTNIIITVNGRPVGAVQKLAVNESRAITMINEVGNDGSIDSTPVSSSKFDGTCQRIRFDGLRVAEAFSRGFIHVHSQIYPFDIVIIDRQKQNTGKQIATVIKNVWIKSISYEYNADGWIITDNMGWEAESMYSHLGGENGPAGSPVATGGEINIQPMINQIERQVDSGANSRRGSMDSSGIIDLGLNGELLY